VLSTTGDVGSPRSALKLAFPQARWDERRSVRCRVAADKGRRGPAVGVFLAIHPDWNAERSVGRAGVCHPLSVSALEDLRMDGEVQPHHQLREAPLSCIYVQRLLFRGMCR
jgi:hypothetical protein